MQQVFTSIDFIYFQNNGVCLDLKYFNNYLKQMYTLLELLVSAHLEFWKCVTEYKKI